MTRQYPLPLPHSEAMEADDYLITDSNRVAATMVTGWPDWPTHCMLILGPAGSGKSHLVNLWLNQSRGKLVPADDLASHDAGSLAMSNAIIAIDDVEKVAGKRAMEETLFHLYNLLRDTKGSLLLATTRPPAQWNFCLADLRSRLLASPAAKIGVPDDELMSMLLIKQFHDRQIEIGAEVVTYILPRIERTAASLRALVTKLDRASLAEGRGVTVALARQVLEARG